MLNNLKQLTQDLFEKDVMLCIRTNSPTFIKYGKQIRGKLKALYWETKKELKIIYNSIERDIPAEDIDFIIQDKYK